MVHNNPHAGEVSWKKGMLECGLDLTGINTTGQGSISSVLRKAPALRTASNAYAG